MMALVLLVKSCPASLAPAAWEAWAPFAEEAEAAAAEEVTAGESPLRLGSGLLASPGCKVTNNEYTIWYYLNE